MNYSTTNLSGTSSVAPGVEHFLLFPAPHGGGFVTFCALLKLILTYVPGWGGSGFTLTGALARKSFKTRRIFSENGRPKIFSRNRKFWAKTGGLESPQFSLRTILVKTFHKY